MAYKFQYDKKEELTLSTVELNYVRQVDGRIAGINTAIKDLRTKPESGNIEIKRLTRARKDLWSKLSKEERAEYKAYVKAVSNQSMSAEELADQVKQMDTNKDRASH